MAPHHFQFLPLEVGNALLSGFFQVFFDRLAPHHLPRFVRNGEVRSELNKWRTTMAMIQAVLSDAEEKQLMNVAVKLWLDDVRDLVYDAEDILDESETESLKRDLKEKEQVSIVSTYLPNVSPSKIVFNNKTMGKINEITERLEDLCKKRSELGLMERVGGGTSTAVWRRPPSTCLPTETVVYGRDEDKAKLLEMLLRDEPSDSNFRVISIVGMAGVGKTTLAQQVYNDEALKDFKPRAWVCVSDNFDVFRMSKSILESITHSSCDLKDLNEVQVQLKEAIAGRRFLLVLDDVWSKNYDSWEILKSPFLAGAPGSIIIVTTRSTDVALMSCKDYELKLLTDDYCWSIFKKHALQSRELRAHPNLESIHEKVITKCGGLPLAARTLGGLLRSKRRNEEWEDILNNKIWESQEDSNILPVLKLSYYHLHSHLKRCFAYCAILPKNYEFEEEELVLLWMAEGLIVPSEDNKQLKDIGGEYFRNLLSMSIFQQSSADASKYVMHNLFNDLAKWASGETSFRLEDKLGDSQLKRLQRARHSSYISSSFDGENKFKVFDEVNDHLRTFLPILTHNLDCYISDAVIVRQLLKFKKLRVLSLRKYHITKLPDSIGELGFLRYLNLADTDIASLPDSIKNLLNLQILVLRNCSRLLKFLPEVGTLINLRHLDIEGIPSIREMPSGMQKLKYLETLSNFIVGKDSGSPLKDLKDLKFLHGELRISQLENVTDSYALGEAILSDKKKLEVLILEWGSVFDNSRNENTEEDVLDMLRPHVNLKKLTISHYGGSMFPSWIEDPSFSNMVVIRLEGCENCISLPSLGELKKLKELTISGLKKLTTIDSGFYGNCLDPFKSLEIMCLKDLEEWFLWDPIGDNVHDRVLGRLRELSIVNCPHISGRLPAHLPSLRKLVIQQCTELEVSIDFPSLCELEIDECGEMVYPEEAAYVWPKSITISLSHFSEFGNRFERAFRQVKELKIKCPRLESIPLTRFNSWLRALEITDCSDLTSLQEVMEYCVRLDRLVIEGCDTLEWVGQLPSSLKRLQIRSCGNLLFLFEDGEANHINASILQYLYVSGCPALEFLSSTDQLPEALQHLEIHNCSQLTTIGQLPETLKRLDIERLDSFSSAGQLPASLEHLSIDMCPITTLSSTGHLPESLQNLNIVSCSKLTSLSSTGYLPASLQKLEIVNCSELTSLSSTGHLPASLQKLEIVDCSELTSLSSTGHLPASLQHLNIVSCWKLTSLSSGQLLPATLEDLNISSCGISSIADGLQNLSNLKKIDISNCPNLESFPQGALPRTSLTVFSIGFCQKLNALPSSMHTLNSLQELHISNLTSLSSFPQQGLPINLTSLSVKGFKIHDQVVQPLHKLTSLRNLYIGGCQNAVCFPQKGKEMMLPTSLTRLTLENFSELKRLSPEGFRNLASLEFLSISRCPKLKSFLKKDLPSSLLELYISNCPNLTNRCGNGGRYWSNISNIPYVNIDGKYIHEPKLV